MPPTLTTVYLNGQYLPAEEAKISPFDRGFLFGDSVYEVIPVYSGRLFRVDEHLIRLDRSLASIKLTPPLSHQEWHDVLNNLAHGEQNQSVYLQISRGVQPVRDHAIPPSTAATVFAYCTPISSDTSRFNGVNAVTLDDTRWSMCHIKATALLANILLKQQASEKGYAEAILIRAGQVTEGAASNIFAIFNGVVTTPPKSRYILPGITRDVLLELCGTHDIPHQERDISVDEIASAEEIWLTSSTREIVPVIELNDSKIGTGQVGPEWRKINEIFQRFKETFV